MFTVHVFQSTLGRFRSPATHTALLGWSRINDSIALLRYSALDRLLLGGRYAAMISRLPSARSTLQETISEIVSMSIQIHVKVLRQPMKTPPYPSERSLL